MLRYTI